MLGDLLFHSLHLPVGIFEQRESLLLQLEQLHFPLLQVFLQTPLLGVLYEVVGGWLVALGENDFLAADGMDFSPEPVKLTILVELLEGCFLVEVALVLVLAVVGLVLALERPETFLAVAIELRIPLPTLTDLSVEAHLGAAALFLRVFRKSTVFLGTVLVLFPASCLFFQLAQPPIKCLHCLLLFDVAGCEPPSLR